MTVGVGYLTEGDGCWLGVDTQGTMGGCPEYGFEKAVAIDGVVGLWSGAALAIPGLRRALTAVRRGRRIAVDDVTHELRNELTVLGFQPTYDGGGSSLPNWDLGVLVTDGRRLIEIDGTLFARELSVKEVVAIGCYLPAVGAASALDLVARSHGVRLEPDEIVEICLRAACERSVFCGGTMRVFRVPPSRKLRLVG